jgi:hypothetical protein
LFCNTSAILAFFMYLFNKLTFYFLTFDFSANDDKAKPIEFIVNAKPPQATNNRNIPSNLSSNVYGLISP